MMSAGEGVPEETRTYAVVLDASWLRVRREFGCWLAVSLYNFIDCCGVAPIESPESKSQRATRWCGLVSQKKS